MKTYALMTGLVAALFLSAEIQAAENATEESSRKERTQSGIQQQQQGLSSRDEKFVKEAAIGGKLEVTLGEMAKDKATNPEVKRYGEMIASDHSKVNSQLKSLAQRKNIEVPERLEKKHQDLVDKLSKLSGAEFDRAYIDQMVKDHRKDLSEFERTAKSAEDPEIKSWAEKTIPTLREHLDKVRSIESDLNGKKKM